MRIDRDGSLRVCTPGGEIVRSPDGQWRKCPQTAGASVSKPRPEEICSTTWNGVPWAATPEGLRFKRGSVWSAVQLPKSSGSHVSALLPRGDTLWAAFYGDGLWSFDGKSWTKLDIGLPPAAREITATASTGKLVWVGTRREGVWEYDGSGWLQRLQPDEPYDHNCQALAMYGGTLYMSTLQDGIASLTPDGWRHTAAPEISSNSPRQMVEFEDLLYLRHSNGVIDAFDGSKWTRGVSSALPRKQASCLAADGSRLYVGQWGGWSEFDGERWAHHLNLSGLQGVPVTAICPDGGRPWIGTQGKGLALVERASGAIQWQDERSGLPDDWIRCIEVSRGQVFAGTFVGGLAMRDAAKWNVCPTPRTEEITGLAAEPDGSLIVATRSGVWKRGADGETHRVGPSGLEAQALCPVSGGLWVGARTGLHFFPSTGR